MKIIASLVCELEATKKHNKYIKYWVSSIECQAFFPMWVESSPPGLSKDAGIIGQGLELGRRGGRGHGGCHIEEWNRPVLIHQEVRRYIQSTYLPMLHAFACLHLRLLEHLLLSSSWTTQTSRMCQSCHVKLSIVRIIRSETLIYSYLTLLHLIRHFYCFTLTAYAPLDLTWLWRSFTNLFETGLISCFNLI